MSAPGIQPNLLCLLRCWSLKHKKMLASWGKKLQQTSSPTCLQHLSTLPTSDIHPSDDHFGHHSTPFAIRPYSHSPSHQRVPQSFDETHCFHAMFVWCLWFLFRPLQVMSWKITIFSGSILFLLKPWFLVLSTKITAHPLVSKKNSWLRSPHRCTNKKSRLVLMKCPVFHGEISLLSLLTCRIWRELTSIGHGSLQPPRNVEGDDTLHVSNSVKSEVFLLGLKF